MNINPEDPRIAVVGAGRLARALLRTLPGRIALVVPRATTKVDAVLRELAGERLASMADLATAPVGVVWLAVSDDAIATVASAMATLRDSWEGVHVLHSSGALPTSLLDPLAARGAITVALHPNAAFTGDDAVPTGLVWSVASDDPDASTFARTLLAPVAPRLIAIEDDARALYHAAASTASNYSVTLFAVAQELYRRAGMPEMMARSVVEQFMIGSARRCSELGPREALTGPIARGDEDVVDRQSEAVRRVAVEFAELFEALRQLTGEVAAGRLPDTDAG